MDTSIEFYAVPYWTKILNWKQITTGSPATRSIRCCSLLDKDTKLKANHNKQTSNPGGHLAVPYWTKILNWKQITTHGSAFISLQGCSLLDKDTKLKANHNYSTVFSWRCQAVPYWTKILNWKQITTMKNIHQQIQRCSLLDKDTKLKANHNKSMGNVTYRNAVPYWTKILNWKQITTLRLLSCFLLSCSLLDKDTKLKANHNGNVSLITWNYAVPYWTKILNWKQITTGITTYETLQQLFLIGQRY